MSSRPRSPGTELNRLMDAIGLPTELGQMYGTALDRAIHNDITIAQTFLDAFTGLAAKGPSRAFFYDLLPNAGYISHPGDVLNVMTRLDRQQVQKQGWRD